MLQQYITYIAEAAGRHAPEASNPYMQQDTFHEPILT